MPKESHDAIQLANVGVNKPVIGNTLVELARTNERIVVCEADLMLASGTKIFKDIFPERFFDFGIAEQNMVSAAAGMALEGKIVFASTFANFITQRSCDQCVVSVAYNKANVKLCGHYAGLTSGENGGTHISVADMAIMRAVPNMTVVEPGDREELKQAIIAVADHDGPVYLRIPKFYYADIFQSGHRFSIGRAAVVEKGTDLAICASGIMTGIARIAAGELQKKGVSARIVNFSTLKPLDRQAVIDAAQTGRIIVAENHSIIGGLGSAIMEVLSEERLAPAIRRHGLHDVFGQSAAVEWQLAQNGLSVESLVSSAISPVKKSKFRFLSLCRRFPYHNLISW